MNSLCRFILVIGAWFFFIPSGYSAGEKAETSDVQKLMNIIVVPQQDIIIIQWKNLNNENLELTLTDKDRNQVQRTFLNPGSTIAYMDTQTLYSGDYTLSVSNGKESITHKITLTK
jgi:hypothetical protein